MVLVEILAIGEQAVAARRHGCWPSRPCSAPSSAYLADARSCACSTSSICRRGCTRRSWRPAALVIFALAQTSHASGFLAVYLAGLVVGNRPTRAHNTVVVFLDAATWLAQIVMFVLLGLLAWPHRLRTAILAGARGGRCADARRAPGGGVPVPGAVPLQLAREGCSSPGSACAGRSGSSSPRSRCWSGCRMPTSISTSPSSSCWSRCWCRAGPSRRRRGCTSALPRAIRCRAGSSSICRASSSRRSSAIPSAANSPYLRRGLLPSWARPTLVVRDERDLQPGRGRSGAAGRLRLSAGAAGEGAGARPLLRRHAAAVGPRSAPARRFLRIRRRDARGAGGNLRDHHRADDAGISLADHFAARLKRAPRQGDVLPLGTIALVAHRVADGRVTSVGLRLADEEPAEAPTMWIARLKSIARRVLAKLG